MTGCTVGDSPSTLRLLILGTAQDGGFPHASCWCRNCTDARRGAIKPRFVSSLALLIPQIGKETEVFLIDAGPDLRAQLDMLRGVRSSRPGVDRRPVDGVFLTHAHIGHYLGLAFLGYEAINSSGIPVYASHRMAEFLRGNGPWSQLIRIGNVEVRETGPGERVQICEGAKSEYAIGVTPIEVPHRDEYSDTLGFVISAEIPSRREGLQQNILFVPDSAPWARWTTPLPEVIEKYSVTTAILDGTFYSAGELPDRNIAEIGHPLMTDTMDLLESRVRSGRLKVYFTHLNHSNPALRSESSEARQIRRRGFRVAIEGQQIPLL
jgi:pyrroloquinoline quinone biosynthesis protein B